MERTDNEPQSQEAHRGPRRINIKMSTPGLIVKLQKIKDKVLKEAEK